MSLSLYTPRAVIVSSGRKRNSNQPVIPVRKGVVHVGRDDALKTRKTRLEFSLQAAEFRQPEG
jgi:hypothetical protein